MMLFAIELSTVRANVAICDDDRVLAETAWTEPQARHQRLFDETPGLLQRAGLDWPQIDLFVAGRGPGAFSGIRIGLMAAQMFAKPGGRPVMAVSSGVALAEEIRQREDAERRDIVVCGDARRGMFWYGVFGADFGGWRLCKADAFGLHVPAGALVVTPHWQQTAPLRAAAPSLCWVEGDQYPTAHAIARLARRMNASEPAEPIYLHPPV